MKIASVTQNYQYRTNSDPNSQVIPSFKKNNVVVMKELVKNYMNFSPNFNSYGDKEMVKNLFERIEKHFKNIGEDWFHFIVQPFKLNERMSVSAQVKPADKAFLKILADKYEKFITPEEYLKVIREDPKVVANFQEPQLVVSFYPTAVLPEYANRTLRPLTPITSIVNNAENKIMDMIIQGYPADNISTDGKVFAKILRAEKVTEPQESESIFGAFKEMFNDFKFAIKHPEEAEKRDKEILKTIM